MKKAVVILFLVIGPVFGANAQTIKWDGKEFEISAVQTSVVQFNGEEVLKVERDLEALPFSMQNLGATVDEPTYVKLKSCDFENGVIEVKMLSQIQDPSPFPGAQGFIGVAFRINDDNSAYESIYLIPNR